MSAYNTTFWVNFFDPAKPRKDQFLGVVIIDAPYEATVSQIVLETRKLGINPGGDVRISELDAEKAAKIPREHKNKLLTDDALLIRLGSGGGKHDDQAGMVDVHTVANELHAYMKFRARRERVDYDLSPSFFAAALHEGVRHFFGVECGKHGLLEDEQQPEMFAQWQAKRPKPPVGHA
jgi:hypothetical protein